MADETATSHVITLFLEGALAAFADGSRSQGGSAAGDVAAAASGWLAANVGNAVPVLYGRQEHTRITYVYGAERPLTPGAHLVGTCDSLITDVPGVALQVRTADCLPVALAGRGVVAMVHAGWRGLAADILGATLARFGTDFGVDAGNVQAVIGVGIGQCHYQVGCEVIEALHWHDSASAEWQHGGAVDLAAFARGRLTTLGVPEARITVLPGCTFCLPGFHSHRRDGAGSGRQWSLIVLTEGDRQEAKGERR